MCKLRHKVCLRPKHTPLKSNFTNYIFKDILQTIIAIFFIKLKPYYQNSFFSSILYFLLKASKCVKTCVNCVTKCAIPKIGWQSDLHGKMNLNILYHCYYTHNRSSHLGIHKKMLVGVYLDKGRASDTPESAQKP